MLKNIRRTPCIASTMSPALVRSPTITSAPIARNWSARSSSRRTIARTCTPPSNSVCTTRRLTLPVPPPAPVTRYTALVDAIPDGSGDEVTAVQAAHPVVVHLEVLLVGHHVEEGAGRRVL